MAFHRGVYRRSGLVTALAVAVTCSFCQPAPAQAANDHLIVPWVRIGPIALGMSGDDVMRIMGEPTKTMGGPPDGVNLYLWKDDLSVTVKKNGSYVTQICALSPAYATAQGVRPGTPEHGAYSISTGADDDHPWDAYPKNSGSQETRRWRKGDSSTP